MDSRSILERELIFQCDKCGGRQMRAVLEASSADFLVDVGKAPTLSSFPERVHTGELKWFECAVCGHKLPDRIKSLVGLEDWLRGRQAEKGLKEWKLHYREYSGRTDPAYVPADNFSEAIQHAPGTAYLDLEGCMLLQASYAGLSFIGTSFVDARIYQCAFKNCAFKDTDWRGTTVWDTTFKDCGFSGVNFNLTGIQRTWFERCDFTNAIFPVPPKIAAERGIVFHDCNNVPVWQEEA